MATGMDMQETAIAAALRRAGFETGSRLHAAVVSCLRNEGGDRARAAKALSGALMRDSEIRDHLAALVVNAVAGDMQGTSVGGHSAGAYAGQPAVSPDRRQNAGASSAAPNGQIVIAPAANGDGAGHRPRATDGHPTGARSSPASREAGAALHMPKGSARTAPAREPSAARRAGIIAAHRSAAAAVNRRLGWLGDLYTDRGRPIVDLTVGDIDGVVKRLRHASGLHISRLVSTGHVAIVLRKIKDRVDAHGVAPPNARWVDILSQGDIDQIEQEWTKEKVGKEAVRHLSSMNEHALEMLLEQNNAA